MKELNKKTFITIFLLFSMFVIVSLVAVNLQNYNREFESIKRNLNIMDFKKNHPQDVEFDNTQRNLGIDNMMVMDYEVYTVILNENNKIDKIISHGNESENFNIKDVADSIINNNNKDRIKIGNLFFSEYSYNYKNGSFVVVVNNKNINEKMIRTLIQTLIIGLFLEVIVFLISKKITSWIVKPAEEALEKQKNFIADASHELKTPLAVIMASSDELKDDKQNSKYVENIKYEADRMSALITSMLNLSKLESGVTKNTYKEENISKIVEKICLTFEGIAFEEDVQICTDIQDNINFKCNKEEIEKLISINLDNAIKHSYKKSIIKVNMFKDKNKIIIEVINSGDPIKKGDEEKIFERFYREDKARSRKENRYGLGLAIAKNIVTNHGGTITAASNDGKTIFKITL